MIRIHLSTLLGARRIKQIELSNATGIRRATISSIYNDCAHSITIEQINSICAYLNCTVGELIEFYPDKK